ncbi:glycosyltransferase [Endozoicomonas sp. GU-1]|uniref:glycosyltransferase n=1 Tax=Endozoicomonas sp. GU-1 TaxID=3009078 RepID=UPI0022B57B1F|nr:glycosyltransferase [Endozoicomonas sp. GU-1]WBA79636.1 glycosyltransferase [Endozoicomonas sp. GU-1]WBA87218.1 glycosyltransferase [Endozoicomonas sp. GU-1]
MYVLQLCHDYKAPFLSVATQYASLFQNTPYKVVTVFIKGKEDSSVVSACNSHEVIFLDYESKEIRGLKKGPISDIKKLNEKYKFRFAIAHRYKALYIATHLKGLFCIGIHHIRDDYRRLTRRIYVYRHRKQIALLGVSKAVRDNIRHYLPFMDKKSISYLYNSLDFGRVREEQLKQNEARSELGIGEKGFIFGTVGRLHADKDQATMIRGFNMIKDVLPEASLVIIGAGPLEDALKKQVHDLGLENRVKFLGRIPNAYRYLKALDCFLLSSVREGLPIALLEAYAAELPSIVSRCDGNEEANEGVGEIFDIGDEQGLSNAMKRYFALNQKHREQIIFKINEKITANFTSASVKTAFWAQPFMEKYK